MDTNVSNRVVEVLLSKIDRLKMNGPPAGVPLPGRLLKPDQMLKDDPRCDPRLIVALAAFGQDVDQPEMPMDKSTPLETKISILSEMDKGWTAMLGALAGEVVKYDNVESYTKVIKGVDGNDITLYISKPIDTKGPAPCVFHTHGGGMVVRDKYHLELNDLT